MGLARAWFADQNCPLGLMVGGISCNTVEHGRELLERIIVDLPIVSEVLEGGIDPRAGEGILGIRQAPAELVTPEMAEQEVGESGVVGCLVGSIVLEGFAADTELIAQCPEGVGVETGVERLSQLPGALPLKSGWVEAAG